MDVLLFRSGDEQARLCQAWTVPALVRALRPQRPQLPILGLTGLGEKAAIKGFRMSDLNRLLARPFNSAELLDALHQTLFAPGPNGGPA
jgi:hypothetical protein